MDKKVNNRIFGLLPAVLAVLAAGLGVRYLFRDFVSADAALYLKFWYSKLSGLDLKTALSTQVGNYNVLYQTLILILTKLPIRPLYGYKLLSTVFDLLLAFAGAALIGRLWENNDGPETAKECRKGCKDPLPFDRTMTMFVTFSVLWLSPLVWMNSAQWGQCDSMYTSMLIWALYALACSREKTAFYLLGTAFAFKLQAVFLVPFFIYFLVERGAKAGQVLTDILMSVWGFWIWALPNLAAGRSVADIIEIYLKQTDAYHEMYMNFPGVWTLIPVEYEAFKIPAIVIAIIAVCGMISWLLSLSRDDRKQRMIPAAFLTSYVFILILPAMHERYSYLFEVLAILLVCLERKYFWRCILIQLIGFKTYQYYLYGIPRNLQILTVLHLTILFSLLVEMYLESGRLSAETDIAAEKEAETGAEAAQTADTKTGECLNFRKSPVRPDRKDLLIMIVSAALYWSLCLWALGSSQVPETAYRMDADAGNTDIILEFDDIYDFSEIRVYLGYLSGRHFTLSSYEEDGWKLLEEDAETDSVFCWNSIPVDYCAEYLGLVLKKGQAELLELVCLDEKGETVLPTNASDYPELFDEQERFVCYPSYYVETMYDEVYHGRTAYEFLHGLSIYETTHPPLGKLLIGIGIALFGMNPFGWRLISTIFGSLMMPVFYLFGLRMSGRREYGILAVVLAATEFMHYTLSRIATVDIIVAFFVLLMFYFMYRFLQTESLCYLPASGLAAALGIAVKWTAVYALGGIGILFFVWLFQTFRHRGFGGEMLRYYLRLCLICIGCFLILPAVVYCLSYIPFAFVEPETGLIAHAVQNSKYMLEYHKNVFDEHAFSSLWYQWLYDSKPLLDARDYFADGRVSVVATMGNPLQYLLGLAVLPVEGYFFLKRKNRMSGGLLLLYLAMLVPWMFIKRTVFIYQYFISSLMLIGLICHAVYVLRMKNERRVIFRICLASTLLFLLFFPVISGMKVPVWYVEDILTWMPKWYFV